MTFRLVNAGKREVWHPSEFLYHVWHPGQDGINNYLGPHDGRNVSTRALEARWTGRILPYVENAAIRNLRLGGISLAPDNPLSLFSGSHLQKWSMERVEKLKPRFWRELLSSRRPTIACRLLKSYAKVMARRIYQKAIEVRNKKARGIETLNRRNDQGPQKQSFEVVFYVRKAFDFLRRTCEFCVSVSRRSRECLKTVSDHGERQVSLYGTDDIAEIVYALTFDFPIRVKEVYDDVGGRRIHHFQVKPIVACTHAEERLIVTSSKGIEEKIKQLQQLRISPDRIIVL
jgi:hypothetical protein